MNALRILHVDDEESLTTVFRIILEGSGRYVVREECCGANALTAAREFQPDLIVLDKDLGDMMGEQVAAKFQKDPILRMVPIAFSTGGVTQDEAAAAEVPTLPKPVSPEELLNFVDNLLDFNALCVG
jgi:two-component system OmpR family response regulator